jgi:PAS domain S-box-containing protein
VEPNHRPVGAEQLALAEKLADMTLALTSHRETEQILEEVLRQATRLVGCDGAHIALLDGQELVVAHWHGYQGDTSWLDGLRQPLSQLPSEQNALHRNQPMVIGDTRDHTKRLSLASAWVRSVLILPLFVRDVPLGVLRLDAARPHHFGRADAARLRSLVNAASIALENARLLQTARQRARELDVIRELGLTMSASLESKQVLQAVLQAIFTLLPGLRNAHIFSYRDGVLEFGAARWQDGREDLVAMPRQGGLTYTVARSGKPIAVADMRDHPLYRAAPPEWAGRILGMPLTSDGRVVGVMSISGAEPRPWTGREIHMLELVAAQAAIAIRNADLYERSQQELAERRRAEEAYNTLVNSSPVGFLLVQEEGIVFVNPTLAELLDRSPGELLRRPPHELLRLCIHHQDRRAILRLFRENFGAADGVDRQEVRLLRPDGSERYVAAYVAPTHYRGRPAVQVVVVDMTERRRSAEQLRQLSQAVEQSPVSIIITNAAGDIEYVNPRFTLVSGYSYEEVLGGNPRVLKSGVQSREFYERLWGTITSGREWRGELCNRRKDGQLYWESASISPILDEDGAITHFLAVKEDITEQRAAQEALRAGQQLLESTFNSLQDAVFIVDSASEHIIGCNPAFTSVFGYSAQEASGVSTAALLATPERATAYERRVQDAAASHGYLHRFETQMRRRDGSLFPSEISTVPLSDAGGKQTGWVSVVRDISERKKQEAIIRRRNAGLEFITAITSAINRPTTLEQVLQAALDEVVQRLRVDAAEVLLVQEDGRIVQAAHRGLDDTVAAVLAAGAGWETLRRPLLVRNLAAGAGDARRVAAHQAGYRALLAVPLLSQDALRGVLLLYGRQQRAIAAEMEPVLLVAGAQLAAAVERARLFEAERAQRLHMEALQSAGATINSSLDLPVVLEQLLIVLGKVIPYDTASVILRDGHLWRVFAGHGLPAGIVGVWTFPEDDDLTQRMAATGRPVILADARQQPGFRSSNGLVQVRGWMGVPLIVRERMIGYLTLDSHDLNAYDADDALYALSFAQQAATAVENARLHADLRAQLEALEAAQTRMLQSEKLAAIGELVAGAAHELNNPLGAVMLYAQLLQHRDVSQEMQRDLDRIVEQAQRASNIVQSLLEFARQRTPVRKPVQVDEVIRSSLALIRYELNTHNVLAELELPGDLPVTMADPHQLQQVFVNLIGNAYQAMSSAFGGGLLTISAGYGPSQVGDPPAGEPVLHVTVADNGPGIDPELLGRIFDPFFTTKEPGAGTGLGLSVCHGIISEHGGQIWAESVLGAGSRFHVELPVVPPQDSFPEDALLQPSPVQPARLLVVDDEPTVRETLARVLEDHGYEVRTAGDGGAALEQVRRHPFDLILCDMRMPGISGPAFYEQVLSHDPALARRILFSTGDVVSPATRDFLDHHDVPVLAKPFTVELLLGEVESRLGT